MKFKIILLRDNSPAVEQAINEKLSKNPSFLKNISTYGGSHNDKIGYKNDWNGLTFLAIKDKADIHNIKHTDILCYCSLSIHRPNNTITNIALISFCDNINLVCEIVGKILDRVYEIYGISIIAFTAKEGATIHRLFEMAMSSEKITDKYFKNWAGRYVGYTTLSATDQSNTEYSQHIFEITRN